MFLEKWGECKYLHSQNVPLDISEKIKSIKNPETGEGLLHTHISSIYKQCPHTRMCNCARKCCSKKTQSFPFLTRPGNACPIARQCWLRNNRFNFWEKTLEPKPRVFEWAFWLICIEMLSPTSTMVCIWWIGERQLKPGICTVCLYSSWYHAQWLEQLINPTGTALYLFLLLLEFFHSNTSCLCSCCSFGSQSWLSLKNSYH